MSGIGDRLRAVRTEAGLSQHELARRVPTSQAVISDIESGRRQPTMAMLSRVCPVLGIEIADVLIEGPSLFEVEFALDINGPTPWAERRLLSALHRDAQKRVSVWPSTGDGRLRLRARASALPRLIGMAGQTVRGVNRPIPPAVIRPVEGSERLRVLVRADNRNSAKSEIEAKVSQFGVSPRVTARPRADLWLVCVSRLSQRVSIGLQGLAPTSPVGLFVPI